MSDVKTVSAGVTFCVDTVGIVMEQPSQETLHTFTLPLQP